MLKITKQRLEQKYVRDKKSARDIAREYECSENKINYWLQKFSISKRSISDAMYVYNNPNGDPYTFKKPVSFENWFLYGLGLGLFWGEGNKANKSAVRLGNTDPDLIEMFLKFLTTTYNIDSTRLRFGLQIFSDVLPEKALKFWIKKLHLNRAQFQKVIVTEARGKGTYQKKNLNGVLTVYFSNTKLRDTIILAIDELRKKPS